MKETAFFRFNDATFSEHVEALSQKHLGIGSENPAADIVVRCPAKAHSRRILERVMDKLLKPSRSFGKESSVVEIHAIFELNQLRLPAGTSIYGTSH